MASDLSDIKLNLLPKDQQGMTAKHRKYLLMSFVGVIFLLTVIIILIIKFAAYQKNIQKITSTAVQEKKHHNTEKPVSRDYISLDLQHVQITAALQMLAKASGQSMLVDDDIKGKLNLHLSHVRWQQAFNIILKSKELTSQRYGNVIMIKKSKPSLQSPAVLPLQASFISLKYAKAGQLAKLLTNKSPSWLGKQGHISADKRTNSIFIEALPSKLQQIKSFIQHVDMPTQQVLITARIVNIDENYERELGIKFATSKQASIVDSNLPSKVQLSHHLNFDLPANALASGAQPAAVGLALVKLSTNYLLDLELSAMESEGAAKIISSPKVITGNQQPAHIAIGEEIPFQVTAESGATAVQFKKAVLSLTVTPQITPDKHLVLALKINQDKRGQATPQGPAIDTREIETQVLIKNGQTIVLGGLYEDASTHIVERVPFLGKLPIIGFLFRHKSVKDNKRELLVFVTPRIL